LIGEAGGKELLDAIRDNKTLGVLDLRENYLALGFLNDLNKLCAKNIKTRKI
jgi:hypothetical protein